MNQTSLLQKTVEVEVLIIGYGLSTIPLIRELEKSGTNYAIIAKGDSIWDIFKKSNRLDFDLVSSVHTSMFSFELVNRDPKDAYPTSKEYYQFIEKYKKKYDSKLIKDWVTLVENYSDHSVVYTESGEKFKTRHLIVATAFKRKMNTTLSQFDFSNTKNKTIAISAMGDSVNLMISKMIPNNNKIILITNGFLMLDKLVYFDDTSFTLDQLEYHNVRYISKWLYNMTITSCNPIAYFPKLSKIFLVNNIYSKFPMALRKSLSLMNNPLKNVKKFITSSPLPWGVIAIKYWPIDSYKKKFDNGSLEDSIKKGYLLNDIAYFIDQGLIELWPKDQTQIDINNHVIRWENNIIKYDDLITADHEMPNLPPIMIKHDNKVSHQYEYKCRNNYMGIIPKELNNVYFIGYIRPTTGGLNNITEMQSLFVHKLIVDNQFHQETYKNINKKINAYNKHFYYSNTPSEIDHLVFYGFYTEELAKLMKINIPLSKCRSIQDFIIYFLFPNNAFKYRQEGPYKVDGVKEMVLKILKDHQNFIILFHFLLTFILLQSVLLTTLFLIWYKDIIYIPTIIFILLFLITLINPVSNFISSIIVSPYNNLLLFIGLVASIYFMSPLIGLMTLGVIFIIFCFSNKYDWQRTVYNDLRNKRKIEYKEFFNKYCDVFKKVFSNEN